jgi:nitrate reductase beta subunit
MVWYVPPLSPIQSAAEAGKLSAKDGMPDVRSLRIPVRYLANLLTAGYEAPIVNALERMLAMRAYMRVKRVEGRIDEGIAQRVGLSAGTLEEMYRTMAIANYEDRYVIPTVRRELDEDAFWLRGSTGFGFREPTEGRTGVNLFGGGPKHTPRRSPDMDVPT